MSDGYGRTFIVLDDGPETPLAIRGTIQDGMEPLRQRFLTYLDERDASPEPRRAGPLAVGSLVLFVAVALLLAAAFPYHRILAAPLMPLGALWLLQGVLGLVENARERRSKRQTREVVSRGVPASVHVVWADEKLERPGVEKRFCLALLTFDTDAARDGDWLRYVARRSGDLVPHRPRRGRRKRLPMSRTDGYAVYLVDLEVAPGYLAEGYLTGSPLPCLAEPGAVGGIELIPYWLIYPLPNPVPRRSQRV